MILLPKNQHTDDLKFVLVVILILMIPTLEGAVTVDGALNNQAGALFTINSGGSLITKSTVTNSGEFNIQKTFQNDRWHLISLPLESVDSYTYFLDDYLQ
jgi:hypothetical protein